MIFVARYTSLLNFHKRYSSRFLLPYLTAVRQQSQYYFHTFLVTSFFGFFQRVNANYNERKMGLSAPQVVLVSKQSHEMKVQ